MNFMFSWQEQYLARSLRSLVRYCSCHSNIKFISSRHRVIFSIYYINTNEIPSELLRENLISSHVKISPLLWLHNKPHPFRPKNYLSKMVWHFIGVYIINRTLHGRLEIRNSSSRVEKNISLVRCAHS